MKILFLDAYFEPEQIAFTHLEHDLLSKIVEDGNDVQIVCPTPTRGLSRETVEKYKHIKQEDLFDGHVHVRRFAAPQEGRNPLIRALRYFWCNVRTYQIGKHIKDVDAVFANSTPPTQGWIAGKVAKKKNVPFIYSLQDVFPDSLVTTGLTTKGSLLWKIGRKVENTTYKACEKIIVITDSMKNNLLEKDVQEKKIQVISNWIDTEVIKPVSRESNRLFDEFQIDRTKYIVLYAGNMGEAQGAEIVLDAAEQLKDQKGILFVVFGGGSGFEDAEKRAANMSNVYIHPLLPQNRVSEVYSMGDVALITCKKGVGNSGMPSKTWSILACNKPIIASFDPDSELVDLIKKLNAGVCVTPENAEELAEAIINESKKKDSYKNIRERMMKIASKESCTDAYLRLIKEIDKSIYKRN